jgi:hypothetical protein
LRSDTSARSVSHTFRAFHGAYESCFLEEAVTTHPATKKRSFHETFSSGKQPSAEFFPLERIKGRLPSASGFYSGHRFK